MSCLSVLKSFSLQLRSHETGRNPRNPLSRRTKSNSKPHRLSKTKHHSKSRSHPYSTPKLETKSISLAKRAPSPTASLYSRSYATTPNFLMLPRPRPPASFGCTCARECVCVVDAHAANRVSHLDLNFDGNLDTLDISGADCSVDHTRKQKGHNMDEEWDAKQGGLSGIWLRHVGAAGGGSDARCNINGALGRQHWRESEQDLGDGQSVSGAKYNSATGCSRDDDRENREGSGCDYGSEDSETSCGEGDSCDN